MNREDIDIMWNKALREAIEEGEQFTRYHFAALVAAAERERIKVLEADWPVKFSSVKTFEDWCNSIRENEREACALECEDGASTPEELLCAKLIRARGQA